LVHFFVEALTGKSLSQAALHRSGTGSVRSPKRALLLVLLLLLPAGAQAAAPKETPVNKVAMLYADHAAESVIDEPLEIIPTLTARPRSYLKRFLSPALVTLVLAEQKITGEIGTLDFSPLWASQDPVGITARIRQGTMENTVQVELRHLDGTIVELRFKMVTISDQFLIDDIIYPNPRASLKAILQNSDKNK
jgi:hypothetical protein